MSKLLRSSDGFTLLETMIAVSIMVIAFAAILMVESSSLEATARAKEMTEVAMLAKNTMIDAELEFQERGFKEIKDEETGQFDPPYEKYFWERKVTELEFPNLLQGAAGESVPREVELISRMIAKYFSDSIREVSVAIKWKKGDGERLYTLTTYWVNLNQQMALNQ